MSLEDYEFTTYLYSGSRQLTINSQQRLQHAVSSHTFLALTVCRVLWAVVTCTAHCVVLLHVKFVHARALVARPAWTVAVMTET